MRTRPNATPWVGPLLLGTVIWVAGCEGDPATAGSTTLDLTGSVVDLDEPTQPVAGAEVLLAALSLSTAGGWAVDTTDEAGAYRVRVEVPGGCEAEDSVLLVQQVSAADYRTQGQGSLSGDRRVACVEATESLGAVHLYREVFRTPQRVAGSLVPIQLSAGQEHACAVTTTGTWCWGLSVDGKLGAATWVDAVVQPVEVEGGDTFRRVHAGRHHTCALDADSLAWCWGSNAWAALGIDTAAQASTRPVPVPGGHRFMDVVAGRWHSCGLTAGGAVWCWGSGRGLGGVLAWDDVTTEPVQIDLGGRAVTLTSQYSSSCAVLDTGAAYCWGFSYAGELGADETQGYHPPLLVGGGHAWSRVEAGPVYACGLTIDGDAYCWGRDMAGRLGSGVDAADVSLPVPVAGGLELTRISAGESHTCALDLAGSAWCWGGNARGELARPLESSGTCEYDTPCSPSPVPVAPELTFLALEAGGSFTCGITTAERLVCWGARERLGSGRPLNP